jgi:hypothetical protein
MSALCTCLVETRALALLPLNQRIASGDGCILIRIQSCWPWPPQVTGPHSAYTTFAVADAHMRVPKPRLNVQAPVDQPDITHSAAAMQELASAQSLEELAQRESHDLQATGAIAAIELTADK